MDTDQPVSGYLDHLPAVFRQDPFVGRFLLAFETVLGGTDVGIGPGTAGTSPGAGAGVGPDIGPPRPGLEAVIGRVAVYFDPMTTEPEFLPWLANWVALSLRADWDDPTKRAFIQQAVQLYRLRGTRAGLELMLRLYTGHAVAVYDRFEQPAHFFQVRLTLPQADPQLLRRTQQIARAIIDQLKPAHTFYALQMATPTMRLVSLALQQREEAAGLGRPPLLILGENTLLGTEDSGL